MIDNILLKFGSSPTTSALNIELTPITIFVGPNNSGKSKVLREIESFTRKSISQSSDVIVSNINFTAYSLGEIQGEISEILQTPNPGENVELGEIIIGKVGVQDNTAKRIQINEADLLREAQAPKGRLWDYNKFLDLYTLRLDGTNRLTLLSEQSAGDLQQTPQNHLSYLFINNSVREEVRRIVYEAFGKYYVIDPTKIGRFRVRLSDKEPKSEREEKGWETESVQFHNAATEITLASDGVRAFSGIITTLLAGDPKITLLDEPEAFLHPSLATKLGKEIGNSLRSSKKRLFASTHSANFLMGCIQSGAPLNIVRLTYKNGISTARLLSKDKILHLMKHPLLRSTGVLNGLFFESVVVCEADSDRAFYQEINERLIAQNDSRGITNCLFINAQNKQTVWDIVKPLRELGIPAVGIVDIDVLKDGGQVFAKPLEGAFIPNLNHQNFQNQRQVILNAFTNTNKNMKRDGGINILPPSDKEATENFLNQLRDYGVFVVKNGELESWLKFLNATGHGSNWLINIFELMGENPEDSTYLKPGDGDVWNFIGEINTWISNPNRKGIPN